MEVPSYDGTSRNRIARLNPDGSLDLTFNPVSGADDGVEVITLQSDGRILIGGHFTEYNGVSRNKIARINSNGNIDNSFDPGTGMNGVVRSIAMHFEEKSLLEVVLVFTTAQMPNTL
ncbi:MAG: delta-60 repeat domain-containing protein [Bacteroidales bacterium]